MADASDYDDDWRSEDHAPDSTARDDGPGGTVHQFPPPSETR